MTILRISATCGSPCGKVNLSQLVEGIDLDDGKYLLSLRDEIFAGEKLTDAMSQVCNYSAGQAKGTVRVSRKEGWVAVAIESPNTTDFLLIQNMIAERLGTEQVTMSPQQSFWQRAKMLFG